MGDTTFKGIEEEIRALRLTVESMAGDDRLPPKRLLSIEEACNYLGIGTTEGYARLRRYVRIVQHGRRILIPKEELDILIDRAKATGRSLNFSW